MLDQSKDLANPKFCSYSDKLETLGKQNMSKTAPSEAMGTEKLIASDKSLEVMEVFQN